MEWSIKVEIAVLLWLVFTMPKCRTMNTVMSELRGSGNLTFYVKSQLLDDGNQ